MGRGNLLAVLFGGALITTNVYSVPVTTLGACFPVTDPTSTQFTFKSSSGGAILTQALLAYDGAIIAGLDTPPTYRICRYSTLPTSIDTTCDITMTEVDGQTNYMAMMSTVELEYCLFKYDLDLGATDRRTNGAIVALAPASPPASPTAVPIFTPLGILAMMSGLLWFGKRRRKIK